MHHPEMSHSFVTCVKLILPRESKANVPGSLNVRDLAVHILYLLHCSLGQAVSW